MSLLLEALKKAEKAKRENNPDFPQLTPAAAPQPGQTHGAAPATAIASPGFPEISLPEAALPEPPSPRQNAIRPEPAGISFSPSGEQSGVGPAEAPQREAQGRQGVKTEPVLSLELPEPLPAPAAPPVKTMKPLAEAAVADTSKSREVAKKILAAKQDRPKRNLSALAGMLIAAMAFGVAAAYYYWQTVAQTPLPAGRGSPQAAMPSPPQPPAPPAEARAVVTPQQATPEAAAAETDQAALPPSPQSPAISRKSAEKPQTATKPDERLPAGALAARTASPPSGSANVSPDNRQPAVSPPDNGIKIRRDAGESRLDPLLSGAYQAFMAGDSGKAESDYRKVLKQTPNSRDALLGLAAIAANRNQTQEAASYYLRVLQLDPKDAAAQAGLIGLKGNADPTLSESRLKTLLAQHPDAGYLHFALGNLYAYQSRWPEAQEAYFNALHADPGNADYAFNLAVGLEHLDQRKPALAYYQRALILAKDRPAGFDSEQLKKRINELQAPN